MSPQDIAAGLSAEEADEVVYLAQSNDHVGSVWETLPELGLVSDWPANGKALGYCITPLGRAVADALTQTADAPASQPDTPAK